MPSALAWIDHDPTARERALRILSLFQERESRDERGLGAIRDSFADDLLPGTSTIQTRLRYMLFVPWVYTDLETRRISPPAFAAKARQMEMALVDPLLSNSDQAGVFGRLAGRSLKRYHRAAVLSDKTWLRTICEFEGKLMPNLKIKAFGREERAAALQWMES